MLDKIEQTSRKIIEKEKLFYYLYSRFLTARHLNEHLGRKQKREILSADEEFVLGDFLICVEPYSDKMHNALFSCREMVFDHLVDRIATAASDGLPAVLHREYEELFYEALTPSRITSIIEDAMDSFISEVFEELENERIVDLLRLAEIPFEFYLHKTIYDKDCGERKRKQEEAILELRQKKEEARMLADIFDTEYRSKPNDHIRYVLHIGETNTGKTYHASPSSFKSIFFTLKLPII